MPHWHSVHAFVQRVAELTADADSREAEMQVRDAFIARFNSKPANSGAKKQKMHNSSTVASNVPVSGAA